MLFSSNIISTADVGFKIVKNRTVGPSRLLNVKWQLDKPLSHYFSEEPVAGSKSWHKNRIYLGSIDPDFNIDGWALSSSLVKEFHSSGANRNSYSNHTAFKEWIGNNIDGCRFGWDMQLNQQCLIFNTFEQKEKFALWAAIKYPGVVYNGR